MEKTISVEERIRRAQEIYNNRINNNENSTYTYVRKNRIASKNNIIPKKLIIQIIVCCLLYAVFYIISNNEYIFSKDFRESLSSLLNMQMDFNRIYNDGKNYFLDLFSTDNEENVDKNDNKENILEDNNEIKGEDKQNGLNQNNSLDNSTTSSEGDINIGGAEIQTEGMQNFEIEASQDTQEQESIKQEKTQMEIDAENIKNSISFEIPVNGYISSTFGLRSPTTANVPRNHTGLDIAATAGTVIKSATDGTVVLASSYGDYGNHYRIQIDDVIIIYAHCKKLYLKEGDTVRKGQEIAEVGSTGNSTGPHLHFEIRKDGRLVDPQLILDI